MAVCVIADPGACWRIPGEEMMASWFRMTDMVEIAAATGADVLKIQLLRRDMYQDTDPNADLVGQYEVPDAWLPELSRFCEVYGLEFMATCYRAEDVPLVDPYVKRWKAASFDIGNKPLLDAMAATGKHIIASFGLGQGYQEWFQKHPGVLYEQVTPLHCVSAYPANPATMHMQHLLNWNVMDGAYGNDDIEWSDLRMGLSDHTIGNTAAIMAVAMGATIIEKHIRHDETPSDNPDYAAAASPEQFREYVKAIREAELMLGDGIHRVQEGERVDLRYNSAIGRRGGW